MKKVQKSPLVQVISKNQINNYLYDLPNSHIKKKIGEICAKNDKLNKAKRITFGFNFKGKMYAAYFDNAAFVAQGNLLLSKRAFDPLHPSLVEESLPIIKEYDELAVEMNTVERFLSRVFSIFKNKEDIKAILGSSLTSAVSYLNDFNSPRINDHKLNTFIVESKPILDIMQARIVTNTISAGLYNDRNSN